MTPLLRDGPPGCAAVRAFSKDRTFTKEMLMPSRALMPPPRSGHVVRAVVMTVTVEMAESWLENNTHNRHMRPRHVDALVRDILADSWQLNGEAIKIASNGQVLDGQHRLAAVVQSGKSITTLVVTGLPPDTQGSMDSGVKRTTGDVFELDGIPNSTLVAAIVTKKWKWDRGDYRFHSSERPTKPESRRILKEFPGILESAHEVSSLRPATKGMLQPSIAGLAHYLFTDIDAGDAVWFFGRLNDGAELKSDHPILTLRDRLFSEAEKLGSSPSHQNMELLIRGWNAFREGRPLGKIYCFPNKAMPMPV
ncbi:hypothetical protein ACMATS_06030 [Streptoverticillium reticulum]|uniref:hypothetical protein n=1 Tax=Streptoverticillium reticulum TaxID=1433415 RepID=UPI0039BFA3D0